MDAVRQMRMLIGCVGVLAIAIFVAIPMVQHSAVYDAIEAEQEDNREGYPSPPLQPTSDRIKELDKLRYSDPEQATRLCREILNSHSDTAEKTAAAERLPRCLERLFDKRRSQKAYEQCRAIHNEMQQLCPEAHEFRSISHEWRNLRLQWLHEAIQKDDLSNVAKLLDEARQDKQSDSHALRQVLHEYVSKTWKKAVQLGDYAKADDLFRECLPLAEGSDSRLPDEFLAYKAARWRAAKDAKDNPLARAQLLETLPIAGRRLLQINEILYKLPGELLRPFNEEFTCDELLAKGDALTTEKNWDAALSCYGFALNLASSSVSYDSKGVPRSTALSDPASRAKQDQARERIENCAQTLAQQISAGMIKGMGLEDAKAIYLSLISAPRRHKRAEKKDALWLDRAKALLQVQTTLIHGHISLGKLSDAESELRLAISRTALELFDYDCQNPNYQPLSGLPKDVLESLERAAPKADATQRLQALRTLIIKGEYIPTQALALSPLRTELNSKLGEQRALQALAALKNSREHAFDQMRPLLRQYANSAGGKQIIAGLQDAITQAQAHSDFSALNDLCGFYVAEIGAPSLNDPFREDLRIALKAAANEYTTKSPMKRVFLLSLLADALPGDPSAEKARQEAMEKGLEVMRTIASRDMQAPSKVMPSLLKGYSVLCVENLTHCHLMIFLDGAERCFARVNPYRKGTLVIKDGKYVTAVVVTADEVVPYRAERQYNGETQWASYYIQREGERAKPEMDLTHIDKAPGDYKLLRVPSGLQVTLEPKTGMAMPTK